MKFEYTLVSYIQVKGGSYRFYEKWEDEGVTISNVNEILPVLNHFGAQGWEFICWTNGKMVFKRQCL